jgi:hypothetical protein
MRVRVRVRARVRACLHARERTLEHAHACARAPMFQKRYHSVAVQHTSPGIGGIMYLYRQRVPQPHTSPWTSPPAYDTEYHIVRDIIYDVVYNVVYKIVYKIVYNVMCSPDII